MDAPSDRLRKGAWTAEEDSLLRQCIDRYGEGKWNLVSSRTGTLTLFTHVTTIIYLFISF